MAKLNEYNLEFRDDARLKCTASQRASLSAVDARSASSASSTQQEGRCLGFAGRVRNSRLEFRSFQSLRKFQSFRSFRKFRKFRSFEALESARFARATLDRGPATNLSGPPKAGETVELWTGLGKFGPAPKLFRATFSAWPKPKTLERNWAQSTFA